MALPFPASWDSLPQEIRNHQARVQAGEAVWAAWNASFDRECWNQLTDFPELEPHHIIDVMAQAVAAGLPGKLGDAARYAHVPVQKRQSGKDLIKLFALPTSTATGQSHPVEWAEFLLYAADDIEAMRGVFRCTLQLPIEEWQEYWANERINLTGIAFDQVLAERAKVMAQKDKVISAGELTKLTNGAVDKVTKVQPMIRWLKTVLAPADQSYLVRQLEETSEDGEVTKKERLSLDRRRIQLLTALLDAKSVRTPEENSARRLLDIRQYGGSTTPAKFSRMLDTHIDGLLLGQFVFNGAPQTGRFSSRGIQLHNLMRDALPYEMDAIDSLRNGATPQSFATLGDDTAISRKLSMLIRPTLIPEDSTNGVFVWGDWSQIEARITPWLAGVESRLDIFREVDDDPSKPDLYTRTAATVSGVDIASVTKAMRQRGKVMELALTFCGGKGALQGMAANYGMHIDDDTAQVWVNEWREANPWAQDFSRQLWETMRDAHEAPGHLATLNDRIGFIFLKDYLGGSLLMRLPSGRFLTYRGLRWETVHEYDDNDVIIDSKWELTFARGYGRIKLWPGFFVENVTQAVAADVLRGTLVRIAQMPSFPRVRAHTHDEVLVETHVERAEDVAAALTDIMEAGFDWSAGLPLKAECTIGYSYSKCPEAQGL